MGWTRCVGCKKLRRDFVAQTFELIAPVQYVLLKVSCSYEMIPNAPKYYKTDWNISLGSNGADWVCLLPKKIPTWLRATNFCINCTTSPHFAPSFMQLRNDPKCSRTLWNAPKRSGALVANNYNAISWQKLLLNCTKSIYFATSFMQLRNDPKCTEILWYAPKH